jgi:hypothetical protein
MIDKAVSGKMAGNWLVRIDQSIWSETTWENVLATYSDAWVLKAGQTMNPPAGWPQYFEVNCN